MNRLVPLVFVAVLTGAARAESVAVVELFTSTHCPSCPLADAYFKEIIAEAKRTGRHIYPLAFHVDYWAMGEDRDPLSKDLFQERQGDYLDAFTLDGPYTPQMVVNGAHEFVGSDRREGQRIIGRAIESQAKIAVLLKVKVERGVCCVEYSVSGETEGVVVNFALVQRSVKVRRATYENVVRAFKTIKPGNAPIELTLPSGVSADEVFVVAYAQDKKTLKVLGAASTDDRNASSTSQSPKLNGFHR